MKVKGRLKVQTGSKAAGNDLKHNAARAKGGLKVQTGIKAGARSWS